MSPRLQQLLTVLAVVVVFAAVMLAMQGLYWYRVTQNEKEQKELARRLGTLSESEQENLFRIDVKRKDESLSDLGGRIAAEMEDLLLQAGNIWNVQQLITYMVASSLVGMVVLTVMSKNIIGLLGLGAGYLPIFFLRWQIDSRSARITEQLPDALDLMARSLQAGHGIAESVRSCAEETHPPLSAEMARVYEENNLGRDFRDSLQALVARNRNNFDLKIFASSVILQRETGGNLVEILENIAGTIRQRFVFKGKVKALTAEARFSAMILGGLPFFIGGAIYSIRPEYLSVLFTDPLGKAIVVGIVVWFSLGVFVMTEITKVEM